AGSILSATAATLPRWMDTSRMASSLFLGSTTCPPRSRRSYCCCCGCCADTLPASNTKRTPDDSFMVFLRSILGVGTCSHGGRIVRPARCSQRSLLEFSGVFADCGTSKSEEGDSGQSGLVSEYLAAQESPCRASAAGTIRKPDWAGGD